MGPGFVQRVRQRAKGRCEYCRLPQEASSVPFEIDHIVSRKHDGLTTLENLALACFYCNSFKGSDIAGFDPETGRLTRLFHPRRQRWSRHFRWEGPRLVGLTAVGRTTIRVLQINAEEAVALRKALVEEGFFPPA